MASVGALFTLIREYYFIQMRRSLFTKTILTVIGILLSPSIEQL